MSENIEQRVVKMEFDNGSFEKNAAESIKTLEKVDDALKLKNGSKSFKDVEAAAERTNFSTFLKATETVTSKLSALGIVGITALQNITNKAIDAGEQLIKSLTIDQVTEGWSKYEDKTASVQTIMNATGLGIDEVNSKLEKLNWFTDETSYNFTDMVSNIGKFTSQNIALDDAVTAMQGIATWAAKSGQGTNEASRAMYNLSQAIGVGAVKLMDWKSIENANMATAEFKQLAIDTAKAMGTIGEELEVTTANFSSTLSEGWFTSDVLMSVLGEYGAYADYVYDYINSVEEATGESLTCADAMKKLSTEGYELGASAFKAAQEAKTFTDAINATKDAVSTGWMTTFETIFGNYEEARVLWTDLANAMWDVFASGGSERNEMLSVWKELGGRDGLIAGVANVLNAVLDRFYAIQEGFKRVFPNITAERLYELTQQFLAFSETLELTEDAASKLSSVFISVSYTIKRFLEGFKNIATGIIDRVNALKQGFMDAFHDRFGDVLYSMLENFSELGHRFVELTEDFQMTEDEGSKLYDFMYKFSNILFGIGDIVGGVIDIFKAIFGHIKTLVSYIFQLEPVQKVLGAIGFSFDYVGEEGEGFTKKIAYYLHKVAGIIRGIDSNTIAGIIETVRGYIDWLIDKIKEFIGVAKTAAAPIVNFFTPVINKFASVKTKLASYVRRIGESFTKFYGFFTKYVSNPIKLFIAKILSSDTPFETFKDGIKDISTYLKNIRTGFNEMIEGTKFQDFKDKALDVFNSVKEAVAEFVKDIPEKLKGMEFDEIISDTGSLVALFGLLKFTEALDQISGMANSVKATFNTVNGLIKKKTAGKLASNIKAIATSIVLLAISLKLVSTIPQERLLGVTTAISVLAMIVGGLGIALVVLGKSIDAQTVAVLSAVGYTMRQFAWSLLITAGAAKLLSKIKYDRFADFVASIATFVSMAAVLIGSIALLSKIKEPMTIGIVTIIAVAGALLLLAAAVALITKVGVKESLGGVLAVLGTLAAVMFAISKIPEISKGSYGILALSVSILSIATALWLVQKVNWDDIAGSLGKFLIVLGVVAVVGVAITVASKWVASDWKQMAFLAIGILGVVASMMLLVVAIKKLAEIKDKDAINSATWVIVGAGIAIAAMIVALGFAGKLAKEQTKYIVKFAKAAFICIAAIGALLLLVRLARGIDFEECKDAIKALAICAALIAGLVLIAGISAKLSGGKGLSYLIAALSLVVGLAVVMIVLTNFTWEKLEPALNAIWSLTKIVILIFVAISFLSMAAKDTKPGPLIAMIGVIAALGAALFFVCQYNWEQILTGCIGIAAVFLALGVMFKLMDSALITWKAVAAMAIAVAGVAGIMLTLSVLANTVKDIKPLVLLKNMGILLGAVLILSLIVAALGYFSVVAIPGSIALILLAAGIAILGVAAIAFAKAMQMIASVNLDLLARSMLHLANAMRGFRDAATIFGLSSVIAGAGLLVLAIGIGAITIAISESIIVFDALKAVILDLLGLLSLIGDAFNIKAFSNIKPALEEYKETIAEVMSVSSSNVPTEQAAAITENTPAVTKAIEEQQEEVVNTIEATSETTAKAAEESGEKVGEGFGAGIVSKLKNFLTGNDENSLNGLGISEAVTGVLSTDKIDVSSLTSGFEDTLGEAVSGIDVSSISSNIDITSMFTGGQDVTETMGSLGLDSIESYTSAITSSSSQSKCEDAGAQTAQSAKDGASTVSLFDTGVNIVKGFINGMNSKSGLAYASGFSLGTNLIKSINKGAEVKSPSRATMRTGKYIDEGLIKGLEANETHVWSSAKVLAAGVVTSMDSEIQNGGNITPVLDMTDVYNQIYGMSDTVWSPIIRPTLDMSGINPTLANARATLTARATTLGTVDNPAQTIGSTDNSTVVNTFNINGAQDPRSVAEEVSRIIQSQVDRKKARWA